MTHGQLKIGDVFSMMSEEDTTENESNNKVMRIFQQIKAHIVETMSKIFKSDPDQAIKAKIASLVGFGRAINEATRIESKLKDFPGHDCLIDENLFKRLPPYIQHYYDRLDEVTLKGKEEPVTLYGIRRVTYKSNTVFPDSR